MMIVVDTFIICLLGVTLFLIWKLNKKLVILRSTREELALLMKGFDEAIMRAEMSINDLKQIGKETTVLIQDKIDKANYLSNDLTFMTDRGAELADKMEKIIYGTKKAISQKERFLAKSRHELHRDLKLEQQDQKPAVTTRTSQAPKERIVSKQANIETILDKISSIQNTGNTAGLQNHNNNKVPERKTSSFKPSIMRQAQYFKTLRKVK
jgi:uncharacterized protein DUF6468